MKEHPGSQRWCRRSALVGPGLALALFLVVVGAPRAAEAPTAAGEAGPAAAAPVLTLDDCIRMAMERQPALAAYRASVAAAADNSQALDNLRAPAIIVRDLPIRRQQAALGVQAAAAGLAQAERDTVYAVTRNYFTVVYARAQERVARDVVDRLKATQETAQRLLEQGSRDVTSGSVDRVTVYRQLAETRQVQAAEGVERALAALREAIGLAPGCPVDVAADRLPEQSPPVCRADIVNLALARRGELVQTGTLADVTGLEVEAQSKSHRAKKGTFAGVVDIHSREVPGGVSDGEYRPAAVAPEMPTLLVGSRTYRMDRARAFNARAAAVADKTRNLVALEAEDAYLRWEEASRKLASHRQAAAKAAKLAEDTRKDYGAEQKVKTEDVITTEVLAAQVQSQYNETLYQQVLALAALERVTGGGFCAGFTAPATVVLEAAP